MFLDKILTANFGDDSINIIDLKDPFDNHNMSLRDLFIKKGLAYDGRLGPSDLLLDEFGKLLVINSCKDLLIRLDLEKKEIIDMANTGRYPTNIRLYKGKIYIINCDSNSLSILNGRDLATIENISLGNKPTSIEIDEAYDRIYVTNLNSNSISIINVEGQIRNINCPDKPLKIKMEDDHIFILSFLNNGTSNCSRLSVVRKKGWEKSRTFSLQGLFYDFSKANSLNRLYLINPEEGYLYGLNYIDGQVEKKIKLEGLPTEIIFDGEKNLYINDILNDKILVIDIVRGLITRKIRVGKEPQGLLLL